jgi:glycosyltransferase involved in cell wall biosynthesis
MTKVAIFLADLEGGGAERVMSNLASGLVAQGIDVEFVLVYKTGAYLEQISNQFKIVDLGVTRLSSSISALANYLKKEQPSILLSALEDTNIIAICAAKLAKVSAQVSTQVIVTVHNNLSQESLHATNLKRKYIPHLIRWFYPFCDRVVAVSQGVGQDLIKFGIQPQQITVIYNPIFNPNIIQQGAAKIDFSWLEQAKTPVILGVGRLEAQKDFATLIEAFALVKAQIPARLLILGEGSQREQLIMLAQNLNLSDRDFALPGFVGNPFAYMKRASLLVMSSTWEGFGNVIVEAMGLGTPVVSTDCPSGPGEILDGGKYGQLVAVKDSQAMAQAIIHTLQNPLAANTLQQRAREFSLEKSLTEYRKILKI